ncbi:MAG: hypothetical protein MR865_00085 [Bacteroidales bacterium]|nr:hypothetical protein [Bacteroidales bacterium]MDD7603863.1 hypothetical protein [Bacteroidales bacterium]MDY5893592.1 hypothetical protein [Candidatus Limisoma sp.]
MLRQKAKASLQSLLNFPLTSALVLSVTERQLQTSPMLFTKQGKQTRVS